MVNINLFYNTSIAVLLLYICYSRITDRRSPDFISLKFEKNHSYLCNDTLTIQNENSNFIHKNNKDWVIVAFSNAAYLPATRIWYQQMNDLGYNNHIIVALDEKTFDILSRNDHFRVDKSVALEELDNLSEKEKLKQTRQNNKLGQIWRTRLKTILKYLSSNKNVFISDVDSIWIKHQGLNNLPPMFDAFHGTGKNYPRTTFRAWGFVLCGCIGAYHSNINNIRLFNKIVDICENTENDMGCDDQQLLNNLYLNWLKIKWLDPPGMSRENNTAAARIGYSQQEMSMTVMTFSELEVQRKFEYWDEYKFCYSGLPDSIKNIEFTNENDISKEDLSKLVKEVDLTLSRKKTFGQHSGTQNNSGSPWIISPNSKKNVKDKLRLFVAMRNCLSPLALRLLKYELINIDKDASRKYESPKF